jgi:hypothetical protein
MSPLPPHVLRKVQRIFDQAARELLDRFDGDAVAAAAWVYGRADEDELDDGAALIEVEAVEHGGGGERHRRRSTAA